MRLTAAGLLPVVLLTGGLLTAGCSGTGAAGGPVSGTVAIGAVPGIDNVPLFLAEHDGMFSSAGLTVTIKKYSSVDDEVRALADGQIDIAAGDYGPFLFSEAQRQSPDLKIVADGYDASTGVLEVLTLPHSGITSPTQLSDKKIAAPDSADLATPVGTPDSLYTAATTSVLRSYGIDMATVSWKPMAEADEIAALKSHQVSAILVTEPYIYQAESELGAVEVLDSCSGATADLPLSGYFTTGAWAKAQPDALADFQSAIAKAQTDASMAGPVQNLLPGYTGMSKLDAEVVTVGSYPSSTNSSDLQRVSQLLYDQGILDNPIAVGKLLAH
jgi:NitT/TauT family transport system substrate-binding protein